MSFFLIKHLYHILYFQSALEALRFLVTENMFASPLWQCWNPTLGREAAVDETTFQSAGEWGLEAFLGPAPC